MTAESPQKLSNTSPLSPPPIRVHAFFKETLDQAFTAVDCLYVAHQKSLDNQLSKEEADAKLYPYLIHTVVLFTMARNQLSFQALFSHPSYNDSGLQQKIKAVPTYAQQCALVNSLKEDTTGLEICLSPFSDEALGLELITPFYSNFQRLGAGQARGSKASSLADSSLDKSFQPAPVAVQDITRDLLSAWEALIHTFNQSIKS